MKRIITNIFIEFFILVFVLLLLFYSKECTTFASNGLLIWFQNMIPSLFPFMILSSFMIRSGISVKLGKLLHPFLGTIFHLPSSMLYVIFMGFLCGFPMGAKIIADMLEKKQISQKEGEFLLTFCNNIGPLYMLGYVMPLFQWSSTFKILLFMYGIPLGYGIILRYFSKYRQLFSHNSNFSKASFCSAASLPAPLSEKCSSTDYLTNLYLALTNAIEQIVLLGGCMIFFNCLQIFSLLFGKYLSSLPGHSLHKLILQGTLSSFMEIGGGLSFFASQKSFPLFSNSPFFMALSLALLTFGGLSCFFQTYLILKKSGLKITFYIKHKLLQAILIFLCFYFSAII